MTELEAKSEVFQADQLEKEANVVLYVVLYG